MSATIISCLQGTPEWLMARAGKVTASRICDVLAKIKSGEAAGRRNYRAQIVAEMLTGMPSEDSYVSKEMQYGIDNEPFARAAYEIHRECMVEQVGFAQHPQIERAGASPDGLIGSDGLVEIKVPNTTTHISYVLLHRVPPEYQPQMLWQMACTGRKWCDFVSFDSRLPEPYQLFIARMQRDEERIAAMEKEVEAFLLECDQTVAQLKEAIALPMGSDCLEDTLRESVQQAQEARP